MKKPLISVVIPAYNEEGYLGYCLESLVNQNFPKEQYEVIVVDNASTDKTAEIAKNFGVKVISEHKKGVVFARQKGTLAAKGKIIVSFDADSEAPPNWLKKIFQHFKDSPKIIAVGGYYSQPSIQITSKIYHETIVSSSIALSTIFLGYPYLISASNFAFKKETFLKIGGYPLDAGRTADQFSFLQRLKREGKIIFDPKLKITTSSRRTKGRLLASIVKDGLTYTFLDPAFYKITQKHLPGKVPDIRNTPHPSSFIRFLYLLFLTLFFLFKYNPNNVLGVIYRNSSHPAGKQIALTFDDGPNGETTENILEILRESQAPATFFVVGQNVQKNPNIVRQIFKEGHIIGNHSFSHKKLSFKKQSDLEKEVEATEMEIATVINLRPRFFRSPFGFLTTFSALILEKKGYQIISWSVDPQDYKKNKNSQEIAKEILKEVKPGAIILLHDGREVKEGSNPQVTVDTLKEIIPQLLRQGYQFVTIPELLRIPAYFPEFFPQFVA